MKNVAYFVFLAFVATTSSLQAGMGPSKAAIEEEIKGAISPHIRSPLTPVVQEEEGEEDSLKTQSQQPRIPRPQLDAHVDIIAEPIRQLQEERVLMRVVPGVDGRVRVNPTDAWPASVHGMIAMHFPSDPPDSYSRGTGTLIALNVILTAAHNIYHRPTRERADEIRFFPAINGNSLPFREPRVIESYFPDGYARGEREDYAVLILDRPVGEMSGHFGLHILPGAGFFPPIPLRPLELTITGYPGDKVAGRLYHYEMWGMTGPVKEIDEDYIIYETDTAPGQSGSAVWYQDGEDHYVVGVHVLGDPVLGVNKATRLTRARYDQINEWVKESIRKRLKDLVHEDVQKIDLSGRSLGDFGAVELSTYHLPNLCALLLNSTKVGNEGAQALSQMPVLRVLNLSNTKVGNAGARALARNTTLIELGLGWTWVGNEGAQALAQNTTLTKLNLWWTRVGDKGVQALSQMPALIELNLRKMPGFGPSISDDGVRFLAQNTTITKLDLEETKVGNEGAYALSQMPNLKILNLCSTKVGNEGAGALAQNTTLKKLNLGHTRVSNEGAWFLAQNTTLTELDLERTKVSDEGARALAQMPAIIELSLRGTKVNNEGARALAQNTTLKKLNLGYTSVSNEGAWFLAQNTTLTELDLERTEVDDARVIGALTQNTTLTKLNVSNGSTYGVRMYDEVKLLVPLYETPTS